MMNIEAEVIYNKQAFGDLMKFNAIPSLAKAIFYVVSFVFALGLMITSIGQQFFPISLVLFILVCTVSLLALYSYFIRPQLALRKFNDDMIVTNHFVFEDDGVKMSSKTKSRQGSSKLAYSSFVKICETKKYFYLFVNKTGVLIVTKSEILNSDEKALRSFLNSKFPDRTKNKLKKKGT
ncbi:MAG: YcxB family protein [Clostridia bacterium]|nr:YcxB family protein [Clostridia bacterium]